MIEVVSTGLVYRNPKPHLRSVHAWHPSLVTLDSGEIVCCFDLAEAVEALNYRTYISRSNDGGATWGDPAPLINKPQSPREPNRPTTHTCRIGRVSGGEIVGFGARMYRDDPEGDIVNRENLGYIESDIFTIRSKDSGRTWSDPVNIEPPLVGPAWEICHRIVELRDGRWVAPTSTWRGWNGDQPNGMKAVALISRDRGKTWTDYIDIMDRSNDKIISWEQGFAELPDGRWVSTMWWYNEVSGKAEPTPYAIYNGGKKFSDPKPTGLNGETIKLHGFADGRILALYRRVDKPGLWANLSRIEGDKWVNLAEAPAWTGSRSVVAGEGNSSDRLSGLKFGFPSMVELANGEIFAVFWCMEDCIHNIRWVRLRVR